MPLPPALRDTPGRLPGFRPRPGWGWHRLGVPDDGRFLD